VDKGPAKVAQKAPTLYFIIAFKLLKGALLLLIGLGVYSLIDNDVGEEFQKLLQFLHQDPEKKFFTRLARDLTDITPRSLKWIGMGTILYSLFSIIEGIGLILRVSWAGWLAIAESAFFIPIEVYELVHRFSWTVTVILGLNVLIVTYLVRNKDRLFKH
jgi:uncharacterized membrane protein (DUF2068 family)